MSPRPYLALRQEGSSYFALVCFGGTKHGTPTCDGVGSVEGQSEGWSGDHSEDETVVVETAGVFGVEGVRVGRCPEEAAGASDL